MLPINFRRGRKVAYNVFGLGEGCLTDAQFSQQISKAAFPKPLLPAGVDY